MQMKRITRDRLTVALLLLPSIWGFPQDTLAQSRAKPNVVLQISHQGIVYGGAFSADGVHVVTGGKDGTVKVWEVATGRLLRTIDAHSLMVVTVAVSPDGAYIVSGGFDDQVKLWHAVTGEHLRTFAGHKGTIRSVVFSPDGRWVLSASNDATVKLWDSATGNLVRTFDGHPACV